MRRGEVCASNTSCPISLAEISRTFQQLLHPPIIDPVSTYHRKENKCRKSIYSNVPRADIYLPWKALRGKKMRKWKESRCLEIKQASVSRSCCMAKERSHQYLLGSRGVFTRPPACCNSHFRPLLPTLGR